MEADGCNRKQVKAKVPGNSFWGSLYILAMAKKFVIEGGRYLKGEIRIRGAKNAVTKQMVAALLAPGKSTLKNVPEIGDVEITKQILTSLGCVIDHQKDEGVLKIDATNLSTPAV